HGAFLPDLALDIEEFDTWHRQEADRLSTVAAGVFEALCRNADATGDGERAIAAAERLVALEPTREDRQRIALKLFAPQGTGNRAEPGETVHRSAAQRPWRFSRTGNARLDRRNQTGRFRTGTCARS